MATRVRSRGSLLYRGPDSGGGTIAYGNYYKTNNALTDQYYTDDAKQNKYRTDGGAFTYNLPYAMPKWRAAIAAQQAGTKNPRLLCLSDSTDFGTGSNGSNTGNLKPNAWPTLYTGLLDAAGVAAQCNSFVGGGNAGSENNLAMDGRVSKTGSGWTLQTTTDVPGGRPLRSSGDGTSVLSFTPTEQVDTFKVWYIRVTTGGTLNLNIDGGAVTSQATSGTQGIQGPITITAALGTHTLNIIGSGGNICFVTAIEAYNSAIKEISVMNAGYPGSIANYAISTTDPWSPGNSINYLQQDLTEVGFGINHWRINASVAQFQNQIDALVVKLLSGPGDVILTTPVPSAITNTPLDRQRQFCDAMKTVAINRNIRFLDIHAQFGSYETDPSLYWDTLHPNAAGYAKKAQLFYNGMQNP